MNNKDDNQNPDQEPEVSGEELEEYLKEKKPEKEKEPDQPKPLGPVPAEKSEAPTTAEPAATEPAATEPQPPTVEPAAPPEPTPPTPQTPTPSPAQPGAELGPRPIPESEEFKPPTEAETGPPKPVLPPGEPLAEKPGTGAPTEQPTEPPKKPSKFKTFCAIFVIIFLLLAAGAGAWWYFLATGNLVLSVTPADVEITVDGQTASGSETLKLKPGSYTVKIEKSGYVSYEKEVTITRLKTETVQLELKLIPSPEQIFSEKIQDFYLVSGDTIVLGNGGKTLYKLGEQILQSVIKGRQTEEENTIEDETSPLLTKTAITPDTLANVQDIIWHPSESLAIFKIKQDKSKLAATPFANSDVANGKIMTWLYDFKRYDLVSQESHFWGADIGDIVWSPDGENVYYYYAPAGGEKTLISASKGNQSLERLLNLKDESIENPRLAISPDGKYLTLVPRSKQYETNYVYLLEILTKKLTKIVETGNNLGAKFAPDSEKILYATYSKNEVEPIEYSILSVIDIEGKNKKKLDARAFLDRATFNSTSGSVIVAVSAGKDKTDNFYKIDVETGEKNEYVYKSSSIIKPEKVLFSADDDYAYFVITDYLYKMELVGNEYQ